VSKSVSLGCPRRVSGPVFPDAALDGFGVLPVVFGFVGSISFGVGRSPSTGLGSVGFTVGNVSQSFALFDGCPVRSPVFPMLLSETFSIRRNPCVCPRVILFAVGNVRQSLALSDFFRVGSTVGAGCGRVPLQIVVAPL